MTLQPTTISDVQDLVRTHPRLLPRGAGTKSALSTPPDGVPALDLTGLAGLLEYDPSEFTFTALAGTRLSEVQAALAAHGQYLPFDPPLAARGATLGGTVTAGLSGPGRYRSGGLRDFILGVRFVDGSGELIRGGGKVVKNAAGFDLPRLMVGSLGRLGALVEVTFKVFPQDEARASVRLDCPSLEAALAALTRASAARLDLAAIDLVPGADGAALWMRLAGLSAALPARAERLRALLGGGEILSGPEEAALWEAARDLDWAPPGWNVLKVPLTLARIAALEEVSGIEVSGIEVSGIPLNPLKSAAALRRYSCAGNVAWLVSPAPISALDELLTRLGLSGLVLFGPPGRVRPGRRPGLALERRVKSVLDPLGRFGEA